MIQANLIAATATLTALTGVLLIGASMLRFGFVANFISSPVLTGFKAGIGLVIVLDQVPKLLGVHIEKEGFLRDIVSMAQQLPATSLLTLTIAVAALIALLAMERLWPHSPAPLVVVSAGIGLSWFVGLDAVGVATVGFIPRSLPPITLPSLDLVRQLLARRARYRVDELHRNDRGGSSICRPHMTRRLRQIASF